MKIYWTTTDSVSSWLIRRATKSKCSHVAVEIDGVIYEATPTSGVTSTHPKKFFKANRVVYTRDLGTDIDKHALSMIKKKLGKPYDIAAIILWPLHVDQKNRYYCVEILEGCLPIDLQGVSPQTLYERIDKYSAP